MNATIAKHLPQIEELCRAYGVSLLELFGSATNSHFDDVASDFDFGATFAETGRGTDYGWRFLDFAISLEKLLERSVDVVAPDSIRSSHFKAAVEASRQTVYAGESGRAVA